jgi:hypothetical protein
MKSLFTIALLSAFALAQDDYVYYSEPEPKPPLIERLPVELNEDGKY